MCQIQRKTQPFPPRTRVSPTRQCATASGFARRKAPFQINDNPAIHEEKEHCQIIHRAFHRTNQQLISTCARRWITQSARTEKFWAIRKRAIYFPSSSGTEVNGEK